MEAERKDKRFEVVRAAGQCVSEASMNGPEVGDQLRDGSALQN
jgi:hypothetical protein